MQSPRTRTLVDQHGLANLRLGSPTRVADVTDRTILGRWKLSAELWAGDDYAGSQLWALRLHQAGFGGIWYSAADDLRGGLHGLALFGKPGHQPDALLCYSDSAIPQTLIDEGRIRDQGAARNALGRVSNSGPWAWKRRGHLTIADAIYVVLAEQVGAALVTADLNLAASPGLAVATITP